jgi:LacI family transcriptional regulator
MRDTNNDEVDRPNKAPTLKDVAEVANVSVQTISRVINGKSEVSPATRKRVLEAVRALGYQPNALARSLVTSHSSAIGLVLPDISLPFYPEIARGVEDGAQAAGYSVFLCNVAGSAERELQALERLRGHRVAGQIVCNSRLDDQTLSEVLAGSAPVVLVNRHLPDVGGTVIWTGYKSGSQMAVEHLLELGRTRIGYLGIEPDNQFQGEKVDGYREALNKAGVAFDEHRMVYSAVTLHGGYEGMAKLVKSGVDIDAVFAFNDHMAVGALRYAATHGIRVPEDVAIVGFGGAEISGMTTPSITTVAVPLYEIGKMAITELLRQITTRVDQARIVHAHPELLIRGSTNKIDPPVDGHLR